jgi:hypothetical protein
MLFVGAALPRTLQNGRGTELEISFIFKDFGYSFWRPNPIVRNQQPWLGVSSEAKQCTNDLQRCCKAPLF